MPHALLTGIGIDITDMGRFASHAAALPDGPAARYLTAYEMDEAQKKGRGAVEYLASRFAAKEAVMKCLGSGMDEVPFKDIEVYTAEGGAPAVRLTGKALEKLSGLGADFVVISLSHGRGQAVAVAAAVRGHALSDR
ncbi:MAG TPA: holo-ACP synthase [Bacillota bacterium]|nr:holo-ACP synthase [Bacillota bacterium]